MRKIQQAILTLIVIMAVGGPSLSLRAEELKKVDLAFCSQLLCVIPFEVAKAKDFFKDEGLDVNLISMKGGPPAVTALVGKSVDFIGTTMDLVVRSTSEGKPIVMVTSTARLPFFALVTSPGQAASVTTLRDLVGKTIGVGNLGATDHLLLQYLFTQNGIDPRQVTYIALGPNILHALRAGQVTAAMVQEPALTLITRQGGRVLANFMNRQEAEKILGSHYQFMGLITRPDVLTEQKELVRKMVRSIVRANKFIVENSGEAIAQLIPPEMVVGGDRALLAEVLNRYKGELYPADGRIASPDVIRVIETQKASGVLEPAKAPDPSKLYTNQFVTEGR